MTFTSEEEIAFANGEHYPETLPWEPQRSVPYLALHQKEEIVVANGGRRASASHDGSESVWKHQRVVGGCDFDARSRGDGASEETPTAGQRSYPELEGNDGILQEELRTAVF